MDRNDEVSLALPAGTLRGRALGRDGPLALGLPGLAANHCSFDPLGEALARDRRVVALDLRGRGRSPDTGEGTYGWERHARDALAAASALGFARVDLVGHSMGGFVAMQAAALAPERIDRVVLIDAAGPPERAALVAIGRVLSRLGRTFPSADAYVEAIRAEGVIEPWSAAWERSLRYELETGPWGVRSRTSREAVGADAAWGAAHDPRRLWPALSMPVLLVRATRPLTPQGGLIVRAVDRDALAARSPTAETVEVVANHYGVMGHETTLRAVREFLARPLPRDRSAAGN